MAQSAPSISQRQGPQEHIYSHGGQWSRLPTLELAQCRAGSDSSWVLARSWAAQTACSGSLTIPHFPQHKAGTQFSYLPEIKQLVSTETGAGVQGQPHISLYTGSKLPRNLHKLGASSKGDSKRLSKTTGSWRITAPAEEVSMSSTRKDMTKNMYLGSPGSTRKPGLAQQSLVVA